MKKAILFLLFLNSFLFSTEVSGIIEGHWTLENSPYEVTGDITVDYCIRIETSSTISNISTAPS